MEISRGYDERSKAIARQNEACHEGNQAFAQSMGDRQTVVDPGSRIGYEVNNEPAHTYRHGGNLWQTNSACAPGPSSLWTELVPK